MSRNMYNYKRELKAAARHLGYPESVQEALDRATTETDGTSYFLENYSGFKTNSLEIDADTFQGQHDTYVRWYDQGAIQIRIPEDANLYDDGSGKLMLKSGSYESTIYVHIVTDFIYKN